MTKREKRLRPIADMEARREQASAGQLGQANQKHAALQAKLEQMRTYRNEYRRQFTESMSDAASCARYQEFHAFLGNLDLAISQLESQLKASDQTVSSARGQWLQTRARNKAVSSAVENAAKATRAESLKKEQRENDDRSCKPGPRVG